MMDKPLGDYPYSPSFLSIPSVYDRSRRQIGQCFHDIRKLTIQRFPSPREERDTSFGLDREGSITVELNFFCGDERYVALT
jgi:hypothetical protein